MKVSLFFAIVCLMVVVSHASKWCKTLNTTTSAAPAGIKAFGDTIVVVTDDAVYGINAEDGSIRYGPILPSGGYARTEGYAIRSTVCNDIEYVIVQGISTGISALDARTGKVYWTIPVTGSSPVGLNGCKGAYGFTPTAAAAHMAVFEVSTGTGPAPQLMLEGCHAGGMPALLPNDLYISGGIASRSGNLSALNPKTVAPVWVDKVSSSSFVVAPEDGSFVFSVGSSQFGSQATIASVEGSTGKVNWEHQQSMFGFSQPILVGSSAVCTAATVPKLNGTLLCYSRADGTLMMKVPTFGNIVGLAGSEKTTIVVVAAQKFGEAAYELFTMDLAMPDAEPRYLTVIPNGPPMYVSLQGCAAHVHTASLNLGVLGTFEGSDGNPGTFTISAYPLH